MQEDIAADLMLSSSTDISQSPDWLVSGKENLKWLSKKGAR
jgi:hypothetical protein